jgi:hypothetical protein
VWRSIHESRHSESACQSGRYSQRGRPTLATWLNSDSGRTGSASRVLFRRDVLALRLQSRYLCESSFATPSREPLDWQVEDVDPFQQFAHDGANHDGFQVINSHVAMVIEAGWFTVGEYRVSDPMSGEDKDGRRRDRTITRIEATVRIGV